MGNNQTEDSPAVYISCVSKPAGVSSAGGSIGAPASSAKVTTVVTLRALFRLELIGTRGTLCDVFSTRRKDFRVAADIFP